MEPEEPMTEAEIRDFLRMTGVPAAQIEDIARVWSNDRITAAEYVAAGGMIIE